MDPYNLDYIEIIDIHLHIKGERKIRPSILCKELKFKNPLKYYKLTPNKVKQEIAKMYPIYNNKKRGTKILKISLRQAIIIHKQILFVIRPLNKINLKFYGINRNDKPETL